METDDLQPIARDVLLEKYAKGEERTLADVRRRVACALAGVEADPSAWEGPYLEALEAGFIPAGRVMSAAGTAIQATLVNCFVQPVGDAMLGEEGGRPGIMVALAEAAETMRRGGGVGYDFSPIRPQGARVRGTGSRASGPVSYMRIFDRMCETVESAGARRGAQMGILRCDHPDIEGFVRAKDARGELTNFNLSVAATDAFMAAVEADETWDLVHAAEPAEDLVAAGAHRRADGLWVYRRLGARQLFDTIARSTFDHAEPGVFFVDRANAENNLAYCERLSATNPCGEQPLPDYGCCCLGSIDLPRFVQDPFTPAARLDGDRLVQVARLAVRMLDNVLELTYWPLPQQRAEAMAKRRIGLGFTGLGDALILLGLRYDSEPARTWAAETARLLRDAAYGASADLAVEKGPFPRFDAEPYLESGFARRLPQGLRERIRGQGLRNSHLLSVAPTGTISLAFADNASNGIEPAFSWTYLRRKRRADGGQDQYRVEDHAYRLYRGLLGRDSLASEAGGGLERLPPHWVTALDIGALDHMRMLEAVQPFVDAAISKTVNVPVDYPFADFRALYLAAWRAGLKGLATFRPNAVTGEVLSPSQTQPDAGPTLHRAEVPSAATLAAPRPGAALDRQDLDLSDSDRRLRLDSVPRPALASLRWQRRPRLPNGNPAWTYLVDHPLGSFAIVIGHLEEGGRPYPFEVWVNGAEQPRGLGALAKSLSMDMHSDDRGWLAAKLASLMRAAGDDAFDLPMPPAGEPVRVPSLVAGFARLVRYRCDELGAFDAPGPTPVLDALMSPKEPKTGTDGTLSWTVDLLNPATGDDFVLGLKELVLPDGSRRPYSVWLAGVYPRVLDGLCKSLSYDMRVIDPAWIGAKLRQIADLPEPRGDFLAWEPGRRRQRNYPSTVAYLAALLLHRYGMLGILDGRGYSIRPMGVVEGTGARAADGGVAATAERRCEECGAYALIRKDGCDFCTACGALGTCG
jgi:ribonucleoside-diphosphate reductase alpha chain